LQNLSSVIKSILPIDLYFLIALGMANGAIDPSQMLFILYHWTRFHPRKLFLKSWQPPPPTPPPSTKMQYRPFLTGVLDPLMP
jgi:hypothetical protein